MVCRLLGLGRNYQVDWQIFRRIIQENEIRERLSILDAAFASHPAPNSQDYF